jgi:hypothetical protein
MLFVLIPHAARNEGDFRFFLSFSAVEQAAFVTAKGFEQSGVSPEWCYVIAYDGVDELHPVFLYTLVGSGYLQRDPYPSPSP